MILLFLIGWLVDKISTRKYEKERAAKLAASRTSSNYGCHISDAIWNGDWKGKYNDIA